MTLLDKHSNIITLLMNSESVSCRNFITLNSCPKLKTVHWNELTTDAIQHIKRKTINK